MQSWGLMVQTVLCVLASVALQLTWGKSEREGR